MTYTYKVCDKLFFNHFTESGISKNDEIRNIFELNHAIYFQSFTAEYSFNYSGKRKVEAPSFMLFCFRVGDRFIAQSLGEGLYWFDGSEYLIREAEIDS